MPNMVILTITAGASKGEAFVFDTHDTLPFGRMDDCQIYLPGLWGGQTVARDAALSFTMTVGGQLRGACHRHWPKSETLAPETRLGTASVSSRSRSGDSSASLIGREPPHRQHQKPLPIGRLSTSTELGT